MADEQQTTQQPDVEAVIAKVKEQPQQKQQPETPNLPEGFDPGQFNQTLKQIAGVESYEQIAQLKAEAQQAAELRKRTMEAERLAKEWEGKSQISPYANDFVKQVDQFFRENRSQDEIHRYFELHTKDVSSMGHADAIAQRMMMENPTMNPADIRLLVDSQYQPTTVLPPEATDADKARFNLEKQRLDAKMKLEGEQAKQWLGDQIKSFNSPEVEQKRAAEQQQRQKVVESWSKVSKVLVDPGAFEGGIKLSFQHKDESGGWTYEHPGFAPKLTPEVQEQLGGLITQYAVENNIPLTEDNIPQLMEYRDAVLRNYFFDDFVKSILIDFHADVASELAKKYSGVSANRVAPQPTRETKPAAPERNKPAPPKRGDMFF